MYFRLFRRAGGTRGRHMGIGLERGRKFIEAEVLDREAELDRPKARSDKDVALADARRALQETRLGVADPGAGGQRLDARARDRRLEGEVEVLQRLAGGEVWPVEGLAGGELRGLQHRRDPPLLPAGSLRAQEPVEKDMGGPLGAHGVSQQALQRIDGVTEAERREFLARRVDVELHAGRGHRATSTSRA